METDAVIYYTCLNNHCPKHRNIFFEGDPQHANCERERLYLEGQGRPLPIAAIVASAVALAALTFAVFTLVRSRARKPQLPMIVEDFRSELPTDASV